MRIIEQRRTENVVLLWVRDPEISHGTNQELLSQGFIFHDSFLVKPDLECWIYNRNRRGNEVNKIQIAGNIGRVDDLKPVGEKKTPLLRFSVADAHWDWKEKKEVVIWRNVDVWGKDAERLASVLVKGMFVTVFGEEVPYIYKDETRTKITADRNGVHYDRAAHRGVSVGDASVPDDDVPF